MIYTQANAVDPEVCSSLITYFDTHPEQVRPPSSQVQDMFKDNTMDPYNLNNPELTREVEVIRTKTTVKMSKLYDTTLYLDYWDIVKWKPGDWMPYHADNVTEKREPHHYCHWRSHSAVIYLNQDYGGGETIFRDQNVNIFPETGKLLMFPAGYDYTHAVNEVDGSNRYTIALWFTEDPKHCMA